MTSYKIAKWSTVFERAESRKLKTLSWVAMPTNFTSNGYQMMLDEFGDDAPTIYGAWCALVSVAASCTVRGLLANGRGNPLPLPHVARITGFPVAVFERLFEWASRPEVAWLEPKNCEFPDENEETEDSPDVSGESPTYTTRPDQTGQDITGHNTTTTRQGATGRRGVVGGSSGDLDFGFEWEDVRREGEKFRRISGTNAKRFPMDRMIVLVCFGLAVGNGFADEMARRLAVKYGDQWVEKPVNFVNSCMRKQCEERGLLLPNIESKIKERLREVQPTHA